MVSEANSLTTKSVKTHHVALRPWNQYPLVVAMAWNVQREARKAKVQAPLPPGSRVRHPETTERDVVIEDLGWEGPLDCMR